jgi:hypothetical protein
MGGPVSTPQPQRFENGSEVQDGFCLVEIRPRQQHPLVATPASSM